MKSQILRSNMLEVESAWKIFFRCHTWYEPMICLFWYSLYTIYIHLHVYIRVHITTYVVHVSMECDSNAWCLLASRWLRKKTTANMLWPCCTRRWRFWRPWLLFKALTMVCNGCIWTKEMRRLEIHRKNIQLHQLATHQDVGIVGVSKRYEGVIFVCWRCIEWFERDLDQVIGICRTLRYLMSSVSSICTRSMVHDAIRWLDVTSLSCSTWVHSHVHHTLRQSTGT